MVKPSLWIDKRPSPAKAATSQLAGMGSGSQAGGWVYGRVLEIMDGGMVRVEVPADAPATEVVAPSDGGVTAVGAVCVCLMDGTGRITQVVAPWRLPEGATAQATGATGALVLAGASEGLRRELEAAKAELEAAQANLADKIKAAEEQIARVSTLALWPSEWRADRGFAARDGGYRWGGARMTGIVPRMFNHPPVIATAGRVYRASFEVTTGAEPVEIATEGYVYSGTNYRRTLTDSRVYHQIPANTTRIIDADLKVDALQQGETGVAVVLTVQPRTPTEDVNVPVEGRFLHVSHARIVDGSDYAGPIPTDRIVAGTSLIPGSLMAEGTVGAREIVATEGLWAKIATFAKVTTEMLLAGGAKITGELLADTIRLATRIVAGDEDGVHTIIDPAGIQVNRPMADGSINETLRVGSRTVGGDHIIMTDEEGNSVASISSSGVGSFTDLNILGSVTLPQGSLMDVLAKTPQGPIMKVVLGDYVELGGTAKQVLAMAAVAPTSGGDRVVRVIIDMCTEVNSAYVPTIFSLRITKGTSITNQAPIIQEFSTMSWPQSWVRDSWTYDIVLRDHGITPGDSYSIAIYGRTPGAKSIVSARPSLRPAESSVSLVDIGQASLQIVQKPPGAGSENVVQPKKSSYTREWAGSWGRSYRADGSFYQDGRAYQGYGGGPGRMSLIGFPSVTSELAGATIHEVWVYVYFQHWWNNSGGTASIGYHGFSSAPGTWAGITGAVMASGIPKPGGKWVKLPTSTHASWASGAYKGITLRAPGDSASAIYYGYAAPSSCKLWISYTK